MPHYVQHDPGFSALFQDNFLFSDDEFMFRWKKIESDGFEIPVAVNNYLEEPYASSKRFHASIVRPSSAKDDDDYTRVDFKLRITGQSSSVNT